MFWVFFLFLKESSTVLLAVLNKTELNIQSQLRHKTALKLWGVLVRVAVQTFRYAQESRVRKADFKETVFLRSLKTSMYELLFFCTDMIFNCTVRIYSSWSRPWYHCMVLI